MAVLGVLLILTPFLHKKTSPQEVLGGVTPVPSPVPPVVPPAPPSPPASIIIGGQSYSAQQYQALKTSALSAINDKIRNNIPIARQSERDFYGVFEHVIKACNINVADYQNFAESMSELQWMSLQIQTCQL